VLSSNPLLPSLHFLSDLGHFEEKGNAIESAYAYTFEIIQDHNKAEKIKTMSYIVGPEKECE